MKIIIDNSNLFAGGGIQVATSFLNDLNHMKSTHEFHVVQSYNSSKQIDQSAFSSNFTFYDLKANHFSILRRIKEVRSIERSVKPSAVFTTFGPSYYKSNCPKVVGFARGHLIYKKSPFFKRLSTKDRIKNEIINIYKKYFFIKNSDVLIFESDESREVFMKSTNKNIKSYTVNNTLNEIFLNREKWMDLPLITNSSLNILCLSANYPHKNLEIIPLIIDQLINRFGMSNFKFVISLTKKELNFEDRYDEFVDYIGQIDIKQIPSLYQKTDYLLMPTLLEIFSTTYLEAMYMGRPIIASDLGFARDICGNSALYSSPLNPTDYANNINKLFRDEKLRNQLIKNGIQNMKRFGDSLNRSKAYLKIIKKSIKS